MGDQNKAVVFGSSGLIGSAVCKELIKRGYSVTAVGRDREKVRQKVPGASEYYGFTGKEGDLEKIINGSIAVFNFSGAPIFKKWKGNYKTEIYESRVDYTSAIAEAIKKCQVPPELFVNGSAAGIYGYDKWDDREITEDEPSAEDFWGVLVKEWEEAAEKAKSDKVRVVNIRTSVVLDSSEGALEQLVKVFNRGLGGPIKPGTQWFPWIHLDDEVGLALFPLEKKDISGPINASSPQVPRMNEFSAILGRVLNKPSRIKVPVTIIRMMFGEVSDLLIKGKKVIPAKAEKYGYPFLFPDLEGALENLLKK